MQSSHKQITREILTGTTRHKALTKVQNNKHKVEHTLHTKLLVTLTFKTY